jgi:translation initiation factor IF-3
MNNEITLANERIRDMQVRLIAEDGSNVGVVNTRDALYQARKSGLDLVAINQQVSPIVVKILDLNKYLYDQKRAAKERAKKSRESAIVTKEIQLRPVTDTHDVSVKAKRATEFLADNCKVKIIIKFRGREMAFTKLGFEIINQFLEIVGSYKFDAEPRLQGNSIAAIISPLKSEKS